MSWLGSKWRYKSGDTARFSKNELVMYPKFMWMKLDPILLYMPVYVPCIIIGVSSKPNGGLINKEFTYVTVRIEDNKIISKVYESELMKPPLAD